MEEIEVDENTILFFCSDNGGLAGVGDNGHLLWLDVSPQGAEVLARTWLFRASETWTPPVVSHGLLYVSQNTRERYGAELAPKRLLCFDLRGR